MPVPERKGSGGAGFAGAGAGMSGLRTLEPLARRVWPPFFLCSLVVITWAVVDGFSDIVYTDTTLRMFITLMLVLGLQTRGHRSSR